jgi:hypothetical protein
MVRFQMLMNLTRAGDKETYLEHYDAHRKKLLSTIELRLCDADFLEKEIGQGISSARIRTSASIQSKLKFINRP